MGVTLVTTVEQMRRLYRDVVDAPNQNVALDTETTGLEDSARLVGFSLAWGDKTAYVSVRHPDAGVPRVMVRAFLESLFRSGKTFWAHNLLYDIRIIRNELGYYPSLADDQVGGSRTLFGDTMLAAYCLKQGRPVYRDHTWHYMYGLKSLALYHFDHRMATYTETVGGKRVQVSGPSPEEALAAARRELRAAEADQGRRVAPKVYGPEEASWGPLQGDDLSRYLKLTKSRQKFVKRAYREVEKKQVWREARMDEIPSTQAAEYAADDARQTLRLARKLVPMLAEQPKLRETYWRVEMPTVMVLRRMRDAGVPVDRSAVRDIEGRLRAEVDRLEAEWLELVGCSIDSPKQCAEALYGSGEAQTPLWPADGAPRSKKTGELSVDKQAVRRALRMCRAGSDGHRAAQVKRDHAKLKKLLTSYTSNFLAHVQDDGRVHCEFRQTGTDTGRFSCTKPPMQTLPRPGGEDDEYNIRSCFVAPPGRLLVAADWAGLEVVVMAALSRDLLLLDIVREGRSMHSITAEALGVDYSTAKTINFALQYGGGAKTLAVNLDVPLERYYSYRFKEYRWGAPKHIREMVSVYHETYAGVQRFRREMAELCRAQGYVESVAGHRRYLPEIDHPDSLTRWHAERQAANFPVQGGAAAIAKAAGVAILPRLPEGAELLLQIHDEWVAECREDQVEEVADILREEMERDRYSLGVPLTADVAWGKTLAECK